MRKLQLLLLLLPTCIFGQAGKVMDSVSRESIPYCTARLYDNQRTLMRTIVLDSSGNFKWNDAAIAFVNFSANGYQSSSFAAPRSEYLLLAITKTLTNVHVIAPKPVISSRTDGFVYDATQDIVVAGESSSDLLRKLPAVQVDVEGVPSMKGSTRIKLYIDGKPSEAYAPTIAEALRLIPAHNIRKIEIITQPSARYDGEGADGILQIYTKRPLSDGSSGTIGGYYQNRNSQLLFNSAFRRGRWIVTADVTYAYWNNINRTTLTRTDSSDNSLLQNTLRRNKLHNSHAGIGITFLIDSLTTISAGYKPGRGQENIYTNIDYFVNNAYIKRDIEETQAKRIDPLNWNFIRQSKDKKGEFSVMGNWFRQQLESRYDLAQSSYKERNLSGMLNNELMLESNYSRNGFEIGVKSASRSYHNKSEFFPDRDRSQDFFFPREIYGAYASHSFSIRELKFRIGLRYEQTKLSLQFEDSITRVPDYKNLLPNILISRIYNRHKLTASYSRKIYRPYLNWLNPIVNYIDSFNISYGNPNLDPEINDTYDFVYSYSKGRWLVNANFYWYTTHQSIEAVAILRPDGIVVRTYQNISRWSNSGLALQLGYRAGAFEMNVNNNLKYLDFVVRKGWVNNFSVNSSYKFGSGFSASAYLQLNGTRIDLQGSTTGIRYYNFLVNKTVEKGKYSFSVRIDNLFMPYQIITETSKTAVFDIRSDNRQVRRYFRIGFHYRIGKKVVKMPALNSIGNEN